MQYTHLKDFSFSLSLSLSLSLFMYMLICLTCKAKLCLENIIKQERHALELKAYIFLLVDIIRLDFFMRRDKTRLMVHVCGAKERITTFTKNSRINTNRTHLKFRSHSLKILCKIDKCLTNRTKKIAELTFGLFTFQTNY
jgi:hypothetical protein